MKKKKNLMDFMKRVITGFMKEGRPGTAHVYQSTYNRVLDFMGGRPLPFAELTPSWLKAFQNYLLSRQLQWNSISTYMRMLRAVYFRAVDEGLAPARFRLFHGVYTGLFPGGRRGAGSGTVPPVSWRIYRYTGNGEAGNRCRTLTSPAETAAGTYRTGEGKKAFPVVVHVAGNSFCRHCFFTPL